MRSCDHGNAIVAHDDDAKCPLCVALSDIEDLQSEVENLKEKVSGLEDKLETTESELASATAELDELK